MSKSYTIERVSPEPKTWESKFGPMVTYRVMFEGLQEPVEINKKPDSPKPNKGDEVFGHIETTEYGKKFKSEPNPNFTASASTRGGFTKAPYKDNSDGMRQGMCFNNAANFINKGNPGATAVQWAKLVYEYANELYKLGDLGKEESGYDKAKATAANLKKDEFVPDEVIEDIGDEPIDLNDIPF